MKRCQPSPAPLHGCPAMRPRIATGLVHRIWNFCNFRNFGNFAPHWHKIVFWNLKPWLWPGPAVGGGAPLPPRFGGGRQRRCWEPAAAAGSGRRRQRHRRRRRPRGGRRLGLGFGFFFCDISHPHVKIRFSRAHEKIGFLLTLQCRWAGDPHAKTLLDHTEKSFS